MYLKVSLIHSSWLTSVTSLLEKSDQKLQSMDLLCMRSGRPQLFSAKPGRIPCLVKTHSGRATWNWTASNENTSKFLLQLKYASFNFCIEGHSFEREGMRSLKFLLWCERLIKNNICFLQVAWSVSKSLFWQKRIIKTSEKRICFTKCV